MNTQQIYIYSRKSIHGTIEEDIAYEESRATYLFLTTSSVLH